MKVLPSKSQFNKTADIEPWIGEFDDVFIN